MNILVHGSFEEVYRRRRDLSCEPTSVLVRPPGAYHLDKLGSVGACNLVLEVDDRRLDSIRDYSSVFDDIRLLVHGDALRAVRGIRRELGIQDRATAMALEGLCLELLSTISRGHDSKHGPSSGLARAMELLHDRFRDQGLRFQDLAKEAGIHPVTFTRAFRSIHGQSPGQYLRDLRLGWAEDQLRNTQRPLAQIALTAGFSDQSHFSRVFKARKGCTPSAFRRRSR